MNKKGQNEYAWIFSLIIGAVILFLAIYTASKVFTTSEYLTETEIMRAFENLLNPFTALGDVASLTLSKEIKMPYETEMNFSCDYAKNSEQFLLRTYTKNKPGQWTEAYPIKNKYIFTNQTIKGKTFWVFSKAFRLPWRVDDMIYILSENYCFVEPVPQKIKTELLIINANSIKIDTIDNCDNAIKVCFSGGNCDINVYYNNNPQSLEKSGETFYFVDDASMYAAVFSDSNNYNCNMKRLMARASLQSGILIAEANSLGCVPSILKNKLTEFKSNLDYFVSSGQTMNSGVASALAADARLIKDYDGFDCPIIN